LAFLPATPQSRNSTLAASARAVLDRGARDSDTEVRREVAVALSLASRRDPSAKLLEKLAADKDHLVREAALVSIGELKDPALANGAHNALDDEVPEVAFVAARTLFKLNQPEGKQLLLEIAQGEVRAKSGFVRAKLRDVIRRMKRPKSAALFVVQQGVGFVPVPGLGEGFSAMSSLVNEPDFSARATALVVLSVDRSAEVRREIEQAFNDSDWSMRAAATQITASRNERTWAFRLVPLFEDTNRRVRYRAAASFLRLNASPAPAK
jgi:HEAT repeat protein